MKIKQLTINTLRNHEHSELEFNDSINVFYGLNGSGKTTILEAIAICCYSKSFLPVSEQSLITNGRDFYQVSLFANNDYEIPYKVNVKYQPNTKKIISSSVGDNLNPKDIIGEIPLVVLSPDYKSITFGTPQDRRDFLDRLLSQSSKIYFEELMKYKKILKQRNNLLANMKLSKTHDLTLLETWSELLIHTGAELIFRRYNFIKDFTPIFKEIYSLVSGLKEDVSLSYAPYMINEESILIDREAIFNKLKLIYSSLRNEEMRRGTSLFGPQKDEVRIFINSGLAKEYASQGQHKSLLISIKFAEFHYLKDIKNETPVVLLDDIFSELDYERTAKVFDILSQNSAQTFVTVTESENLKKVIPDNSIFSFYKVSNGRVSIEK